MYKINIWKMSVKIKNKIELNFYQEGKEFYCLIMAKMADFTFNFQIKLWHMWSPYLKVKKFAKKSTRRLQSE